MNSPNRNGEIHTRRAQRILNATATDDRTSRTNTQVYLAFGTADCFRRIASAMDAVNTDNVDVAMAGHAILRQFRDRDRFQPCPREVDIKRLMRRAGLPRKAIAAAVKSYRCGGSFSPIIAMATELPSQRRKREAEEAAKRPNETRQSDNDEQSPPPPKPKSRSEKPTDVQQTTPQDTVIHISLADLGEIDNLDVYHENDSGNAEMFVDRYSKLVRYSHAHESWFIWNGNRWVPDADESVHQLALELSNELIADSVEVTGQRDERKLRRGIGIGSRNQISSMLWLARSHSRIVIGPDEINIDDFLVGVRNGVIDLRTGKRRDGRKRDFITKSCGCDYDPVATAPRWMTFLAEIFNNKTDLIDYIQRAVGYTLSGDTREQCLFFLYGFGANGKSTFIEVLTKLLGDYATTASQNVLCVNRYAKEPLDEIAKLEGARFVKIAETGAEQMDEVRIKLLTGGDTITGKPHYKAPMNFQPKFKLWIFGNSKPAIYGVDLAIWRRIKMIPFGVEFLETQQDPMLKRKLLAELSGILNWAIEGALKWQAEGRLAPPQCVVDATAEYRADQDILREFIAEKIERAKDFKLAHKELYRAYKAWHEETGAGRPFSSKKIAQMLRDRGYEAARGTGNVLFWWGIGLTGYSVTENNSFL